MPPYGIIEDFLPDEERLALLEWAIAARDSFKPAKVFKGDGRGENRVEPGSRIAWRHQGLGPFEDMMRSQLLARLNDITAAAGYDGPEPRSIELELNAYGDGAHFAAHNDIPVGPMRRPVGEGEGEDRFITAVYYFYREPKRFSGGALSLYRFGVEPATCGEADRVLIEPVQNRLAVFPSWAVHGVDKVDCDSSDFADFRFGLNCWFCRPLQTA